jgi:hypothetical protein
MSNYLKETKKQLDNENLCHTVSVKVPAPEQFYHVDLKTIFPVPAHHFILYAIFDHQAM